MAGGVALHSVRPATRSRRASWIEWLERPFAQILLGTLLPLLVLALLWDLSATLPWKAFYLAAGSSGCALSFLAAVRRRHSDDFQAWLAGIRACLVALTLPWVLFIAAVAATFFAAWMSELPPEWWLAFALLPVFGLIGLPSLMSLMVFALWSRQAWRAAQATALERRRTFAVLGWITPLVLGGAVELVFRGAESVVTARYVDVRPRAGPESLAKWRPIARIHGWTTLESRCGFDEYTLPTPTQQRARTTLAALTGFDGGYSSVMGD